MRGFKFTHSVLSLKLVILKVKITKLVMCGQSRSNEHKAKIQSEG